MSAADNSAERGTVRTLGLRYRILSAATPGTPPISRHFSVARSASGISVTDNASARQHRLLRCRTHNSPTQIYDFSTI